MNYEQAPLEHQLANNERMQTMPGFGGRLSHRETAELVNYLRVRWGGRPADVTSEQVAEIVEEHGTPPLEQSASAKS